MGHQDWVSKIRYIPTSNKSSVAGHFFASVGWDGYLKVWNNQTFNIKDSFKAHDANINCLADSPSPVTCVAFNPKCHWIAIGTENKWVVWDFESKDTPVVAEGEFKLAKISETQTETKKVKQPKYYQVTSISWNTLGTRLFVGYSNGDIKVYEITIEKAN